MFLACGFLHGKLTVSLFALKLTIVCYRTDFNQTCYNPMKCGFHADMKKIYVNCVLSARTPQLC